MFLDNVIQSIRAAAKFTEVFGIGSTTLDCGK